MNSSPVLWNKEEDGKVQPSLRPPRNIHVNNNSQLATQKKLQKLNKSDNPSINEHSQQNDKLVFETILKESELNVNAVNPVFKSKSQDRLKPYEVKPTNSEENVSKSTPDLNQINDVINTLTKNHGQFYEFLENYLENLEPNIPDVMAPSIVAEVIVEHALNNPNFRYTAARLCSFIEQNSPRFRAELHLLCIKLIEEKCDAKNVLPFIVELYTQIPYSNFNIYGNLLIYAFKKILELEEIDNVRWICQALKLTGFSLEQSNKFDLDQVFNELKFLRGRVDGSPGFLLESIFILRASNWGHYSDESDSDQDVADAFDGLESEIFYEVKGKTLKAEEHAFIASHINPNDGFDTEDFDPDELCDPEPKMDEEIQEAFKEFVKIQSKQ